MPFVPAPNVMLVEPVFDWDGQTVENTLYFRFPTAPSLTDMAAFIDEVNAFFRSQILPALTTAISLVRVVGTLLDAVDSLQVISVASLPAFGTNGAGVPNNVSLAVAFKTASRGRSARGRNFIPGLPVSGFTKSELNTTLVTAFNTAYEELRVLGVDAGWEQVVISRYSGFTVVAGKKVPTPRTTAVIRPVTQSILNDNVADSQRRRLPGRGS